MCKRIFKFELQLSSYWQNIKLSRYCPKFHSFTNIIIFQVYLHLFRPTASSLYILWQGHVRNTLFHFCQLWAVKANKLSVNASKTNFMILGTPKLTSTKTHQDFNITLNDTLLERAKFTKFLGVLIDECLTWKNHIDCISKTIKGILVS